MDTKWWKITKNRVSLTIFSVWNSCYTLHKVPWYVHCDISMAIQWAPDPIHSKGEIRVFLLQEVLFAFDVHSKGVNKHGHYTAHWHNKYILFDGLTYNTLGYFASCIVFFRAPEGQGKVRAMSKMSASIIC